MTRTEASTQLRETSARLRHPVVAVGLGMVLVLVLFRTWMLQDGWFFQDDYEMLAFAATEPLGIEHLLQPDNGHVMPATRLIYYVVAHAGWLNWSLAASLAVTLQGLAGLAALAMLVTLFGPRWWVLAPLAIYLTSVITAQAAVWWISAINQTPVQIAFFGSVACWVVYLRGRRVTPLVGTVLFLVFGLLFFQKILLVIPVLIWLMLAYFVSGSLPQRVIAALRLYWPSALTIGIVSVAYLVYFLVNVPDTTPGSVVNQAWLPTFNAMFFDAFASGIVGGPNGWRPTPGGAWADPPVAQLVWAWAVLLAVIGLSLVLHRRSGRAWVLLVAYYMLLTVLITVTRSSVLGSDIGLAYRLQTDGLCAAVLALALAYLPLQGAAASNTLVERSALPEVTPALTLAGVIVLGIVCLNGIGNWIWFADDFQGSNKSRPYVTSLHEDGLRLGRIDVADSGLPDSVRRSFSGQNHLSDLASVLLPQARFPVTTNDLAVTTREGEIHQALLRPVAHEKRRPAGGCGWRLEAGDSLTIALTQAVSGPQWLRLGYLGNDVGTATIRVDDAATEIRLKKGLQSAFVRVDATFDRVRLDNLEARGLAICLDAVQVGFLRPGARL